MESRGTAACLYLLAAAEVVKAFTALFSLDVEVLKHNLHSEFSKP